ncbi:MAG: glycosyltransferase family 4 protein [Armatimonadota bacterium]|jgi:glycosyltransferase involved in cell wall biosynthesis
MRITHLAAGAANMYCGACSRDAAMARALIARGHQVQIVPLYTPLRLDGAGDLPVAEVHLGAMNAYLQQLSGLFTRLPRPLSRLLDHDRLLRFVSRFAVSTKPAQLGPMTVSVLAGADGRQRVEFERLVEFLGREARPDVVTITNSMLSGVAPLIKQRLGIAVLCEVKGEDGFIEALPRPHRDEAVALARRNARSIDRFIAPTEQYADRMAAFLDVEREQVEVVRSIIDGGTFARSSARPREPFTVGYVSVITPRKGLHLLVDALANLVEQGRDVRLRVAGQVLDRGYWRQLRRAIRRCGLADRVDVLGEVSRDEKVALLHSLSAFCQPSIKPEALGTASLEAQAAGVPVVAPDEGVFAEMLGLTEGGLLFESGRADALAAQLAALMDDPERADEVGESGARGVGRLFSADAAASAMERILGDVTESS